VGEALHDVKTYAHWRANQNAQNSYEYLKKVLKLIQWQDRVSLFLFFPLLFPHILSF
jgi:hypothetical protein